MTPLTRHALRALLLLSVITAIFVRRPEEFGGAGLWSPSTQRHLISWTNEASANHDLPPRALRLPSPETPFVFLHLRKAAGSAMRTALARALDRLKAPTINGTNSNRTTLLRGTIAIPGEPSDLAPRFYFTTERLGDSVFPAWTLHPTGGRPASATILHPRVYSLAELTPEELRNISVVAGHFSAVDVEWLLEAKNGSNVPMLKGFSCLVNLRHPVEIFVSFYYERSPMLDGHGRIRPLYNISASELGLLLDESLSPQQLFSKVRLPRHSLAPRFAATYNASLDPLPFEAHPLKAALAHSLSDSEYDQNMLYEALLDVQRFQCAWFRELGGPALSFLRMMTGSPIPAHPWVPATATLRRQQAARPADIALAKRNLDACIVVSPEDPRSEKVLNWWFPWLDAHPFGMNATLTERRAGMVKLANLGGATPGTKGDVVLQQGGLNVRFDEFEIPQELRPLIRTAIGVDLELFEYAMQRFGALAERATTTGSSK